MKEKRQESNLIERKQKYIITAGVIVVIILAIIIGTIAWFYTQRSAATVSVMGTPSDLSLIGANGGELRLDMSPSDSDAETDDNGKVVLKRVFGVKSENNHWLEVAHTTNTDEFSFKIYQATAGANGTYTYDSNKPITGQYLNETNSNSGTSSTTEPFYGANFSASDTVQMNAIPLYWMSCQLPVNPDKSGETYYYLEVTWQETEKETDVFYIFASDAVTS